MFSYFYLTLLTCGTAVAKFLRDLKQLHKNIQNQHDDFLLSNSQFQIEFDHSCPIRLELTNPYNRVRAVRKMMITTDHFHHWILIFKMGV